MTTRSRPVNASAKRMHNHQHQHQHQHQQPPPRQIDAIVERQQRLRMSELAINWIGNNGLNAAESDLTYKYHISHLSKVYRGKSQLDNHFPRTVANPPPWATETELIRSPIRGKGKREKNWDPRFGVQQDKEEVTYDIKTRASAHAGGNGGGGITPQRIRPQSAGVAGRTISYPDSLNGGMAGGMKGVHGGSTSAAGLLNGLDDGEGDSRRPRGGRGRTADIGGGLRSIESRRRKRADECNHRNDAEEQEEGGGEARKGKCGAMKDPKNGGSKGGGVSRAAGGGISSQNTNGNTGKLKSTGGGGGKIGHNTKKHSGGGVELDGRNDDGDDEDGGDTQADLYEDLSPLELLILKHDYVMTDEDWRVYCEFTKVLSKYDPAMMIKMLEDAYRDALKHTRLEDYTGSGL